VNYSKASWAVLAALRFVLAMIVFDGHLGWLGLPSDLTAFLPRTSGRVAVLAFLLVSGVSVGHSFLERCEGFYARRFLRIYPLYFAAIVFTAFVMGLVPAPARFPGWQLGSVGWPTMAGNLLLLQGLAVIPLPYDGPLWSLSVEVWLYALTPLFARLPRAVLYGLMGASMFCFGFLGGDFLGGVPGLGVLKWCWPWWIGFLLARDGRKIPAFALGLLGAGSFWANAELAAGGWQNPALFVLCLVAVLWADLVKLPRIAQGLASFLGDASYPLYLFHLPMIILMFGRFGVRAEGAFMAVVLASAALLVVFYEGLGKRVFWKPLTLALVRLLPSSWTLFHSEARRKAAPVAPDTAPALVA
jgi:peptidoglycan/LPS O-acetylase OafA/YrhL